MFDIVKQIYHLQVRLKLTLCFKFLPILRSLAAGYPRKYLQYYRNGHEKIDRFRYIVFRNILLF